MNAPVTRRTLLGASASVVVVGLPVVFEAATPAASPAHADADLFRLLDAWGPARAASDVAGERNEALWDLFVEQEPPRPAALRYGGDDGLGCGFDVEALPDGSQTAVYGLDEIEKLRAMPLPQQCKETFTPHPDFPNDKVLHRTWVPDERRIARRAEVLEAHDMWWAECRAIRDRLGVTAADSEDHDAFCALQEIEAAILTTAPATAAGLVAKARWATGARVARSNAPEWAERIAADLVSLADRGEIVS